MSDVAKRTRRNLTKAAGLVIGGLFGLGISANTASADRGRGHGGGGHGGGHGGGGHGGGGHGGGWGHGRCFLRGTQIRTAGGYRNVEDLTAGDYVLARFGGRSVVRSVHSYSHLRHGSDHAWPDQAKPVRIVRSALEDNVPERDLYLTPAHALFIDGALVPAGNLVNGTSITIDDAEEHDTLEYFHVELDRHDAIEADGAWCETMIEAGAADHERCAPLLDFAGGSAELMSRLRSAAAILIDRRQQLDVIRDRLEERGLVLSNAAREIPTASAGIESMMS